MLDKKFGVSRYISKLPQLVMVFFCEKIIELVTSDVAMIQFPKHAV